MQRAEVSHRNQRLLYWALCGLAGAAVVQQLLFPITPQLPRLPDDLLSPLPGLELEPVSRDNYQYHVRLERHLLVGSSQQYRFSDSTYFILTPVSSWMGRSIEPLSISTDLFPPHLASKVKVSTIRPHQLQIAVGKIGSSSVYQGCLVSHGKVWIDQQFLAAPRSSFLRKTANMIWPFSKPVSTCVLITTNQRSLLDGSKASREFIKGLAKNIVWSR